MSTPVSHVPRCHLCNKLVPLEFAKTDENGRTVHEGCYLLKIRAESATPLSEN